MRIPRKPKPPKLLPYIPKGLPRHVSRLGENFKIVRSWSQKYPNLDIPKRSFNKLDNSFAELQQKLESTAPPISSRPLSSPKTKKRVSATTASRDSGPTPWANGGDTRGWLGELLKNSETSSELSKSLLLHLRPFGHSDKEDIDDTAHFIELQARAGTLKENKLTTDIPFSPKIGTARRPERGPRPFLESTKTAKPIKCDSKSLEWIFSSYVVFNSRGLSSTIFSNLMRMPRQKSHEAPICDKMQRLEMANCGLKASGLAEKHILEPLDLAVISYLQYLSREELSHAAQAVAKESFLPTCHTLLSFEMSPLESEDAEIMQEVGKRQVSDLEAGGLDSAAKLECDGAPLGQIHTTRLSDEVQRTRVIKVFVGYSPCTIQSLSRADIFWLNFLAMSGKDMRQIETSSFAGLAHVKELIDRELMAIGMCCCGAKHRPKRSGVLCETCKASRDTAEGSSSGF